jgi:hypothetical protein
MTRLLPLVLLAAACQEFSIDGFETANGASNPPSLATPVWTDRVKQGLKPAVDVLWVIDDSCSMVEEQDALARNLGVFLDYFLDSGTNWHMGVVTTDVLTGTSGALESSAGYRVLTNDTPYVEDVFEQLVRVGVGGSGEERGLKAAFDALVKPSRELQITNRGINRENAALHVIVISDEDDQSTLEPEGHSGPWDSVTVSEFTSYLRNVKQDPETPVTFSSIVGPDPGGCFGSGGSAAPAAKYLAATAGVGGLSFSICEEEWAPILDSLGALTSGVRKEFFLSKVPVPGTIKVKVTDWNGNWRGFDLETDPSELPAICADEDAPWCFAFTYDMQRNSMNFVDYTPSPLAQIEITYELLEAYNGDEDW